MDAQKPRGSGSDAVRSVRVPAEVWQAAKARATAEGVTVSYVLRLLVDGYSKGLLDLPTITTTYTPIRPEDVGPDAGSGGYHEAR